MTDERLRLYVEELTLALEESGIPRTAGRILAWLLVCNPPQQSMNELVEGLQVSKSSVSTATRTLIQMGLVERVSLPGQRQDFYRMPADGWSSLMQASLSQVTAVREVAGRGIDLLGDLSGEQRQRLQDLFDLYAFVEREVPGLIARWEADRTQINTDSAQIGRTQQ